MQADKIIGGIERFFFDIVGSLIPGAMLLVGLWLLLTPVALFGWKISPPSTTAEWWVFVAFAYAVGNGISTFGEQVVEPSFLIITWPVRLAWLKMGRRLNVMSRDTLLNHVAERASFKHFARRVFPGLERPGPGHVHELRNIAMSVISPEDRATVVRFMFLSLLSLGTATVIWLLGAAMLLNPSSVSSWRRGAIIVGATFLLSLFFLKRRFEFFNRAIRLPFDIAVAPDVGAAAANVKIAEAPASAGPKTVYLAGGHQTAWRQRVMAEVRGLRYRDPSTHGLTEARAYTAWDLQAVRNSDLVFAYFESTNPSGYGLAVEVGYGAALRKHIIFVDERSAAEPAVGRYLHIIRETADVHFKSLDEGIEYLRRLASLTE